ncbi:MAG: hypothetical protein ACR2HV_11385 [Acidimicrobiales bacterium]
MLLATFGRRAVAFVIDLLLVYASWLPSTNDDFVVEISDLTLTLPTRS